MSCEDLNMARAARAAKDKAAADKSKGKRGRKCKVSAREAESEVEGEVEGGVDAHEVGSPMPTLKDRRAKRSNVQEPEPWRVPVALIYNRAM
jgi:hypothetical protein